MLAEKFRQEVMEDDITKKLVVHEGKEMAEIFDIELQKHEATRKLVKQNMAAQKNILQAMTEVSTINDINVKRKASKTTFNKDQPRSAKAPSVISGKQYGK